MLVKDLKKMLNDVPNGMTLEQFDELPFCFSVNGLEFETACKKESGVITFIDDCNEDGTPKAERGEDINVFALMPHNLTDKLIESGDIVIKSNLN